MISGFDPALYAPWMEGLRADEIRITRCSACSRWQWYPSLWCPRCGGENWDWVPVAPQGHLVSWTRVVRPTVPMPELPLPYVVSLVELPEADGARVLAVSDGPDPTIGARVELECRDLGSFAALFLRTS